MAFHDDTGTARACWKAQDADGRALAEPSAAGPPVVRWPMVDTVFLVGTGAVEGAWDPVLQAICDVDADAFGCTKSDLANFYMAKLVAVFRAIRASEAHGRPLTSPIPDQLRRLKMRISTRLKEATSSQALRLRPFFQEVVADPEWGSSKVFVTTNWDELIEHAFPNATVHHVHGSITDPDSLFLPSDFAFDCAHSSDVRNKMLIAQRDCIEGLWNTRTVVIYGLSLDPLDSELAAVCATGFGRADNQERLEKIVIYNSESAGPCIQDRVKLLLPHACAPRVEWRAVRATT